MFNKNQYYETIFNQLQVKYDVIFSKLKKCGFSDKNCLKSIISTGLKSEREASEWLVNHIEEITNPPNDDNFGIEDYYIFLCPNFLFNQEIIEFWEYYQQKWGWNFALDYVPHITLIPKFQIPDGQILQLYKIIMQVVSQILPVDALSTDSLQELITSDAYDNKKNFLGYQVVGQMKVLLEKLSNKLLQELDKIGLTMSESVRSSRKGIYHLSLAYGYNSSQTGALTSLLRRGNTEGSTEGISSAIKSCNWLSSWSICLFSCDARMRQIEELYEMNHSMDDCPHKLVISEKERNKLLNYQMNDLVGVLEISPNTVCDSNNNDTNVTVSPENEPSNHKPSTNNSNDETKLDDYSDLLRLGWVKAINLNTGQQGIFLIECGTRVGYHRAWKKHLEFPLDNPLSKNKHPSTVTTGDFASLSLVKQPVPVTKSTKSSSSSVNKSKKIGNDQKFIRRFVVMRHGERMDFCFRNWINKCFDERGVYHRTNLNMPVVLPQRRPSMYFYDSPLTNIGMYVAHQTGLEMRAAGMSFSACYSSPSFRCVQTATECLRGMNQLDIGIRVEPLLFEWMGWYKSQRPSFFTNDQLAVNYFPVMTQYKSLSSFTDLDPNESTAQYYERKGKLFKKILEHNKKRGTSLLIVGHAASLDVCTRAVISSKNLSGHTDSQLDKDLHSRASQVPFCGMVYAVERATSPAASYLISSTGHSTNPVSATGLLSKWHLVEPPAMSFAHTRSQEYNWKDAVVV